MNKTILCAAFSFLAIGTWADVAQASSQGGFLRWGPAQPLGDGSIRTYAAVLPHGRPLKVGVLFEGDALDNLPQEHSDGTWDVLDGEGNVVMPCCGHETVLEMPSNLAHTQFEHFVLNWNPHGHAPEGVYSLPHFDFHFYTMTNEERVAIEVPLAEDMCILPGPEPFPVPVTCETFEIATQPLPADMMPPEYGIFGAVEPGMGNHLVNPNAPEFNGEPFTHTWIYGSYAGELTFYEPMMTREYLLTQPNQCTDILVPQAQPTEGFYPTKYCVRYLPFFDLYTVSLERFRWFEATNGEL